ncbi:MAG: nuclear transport factor 2 family protein [Gammaproteobacteria bacterium]
MIKKIQLWLPALVLAAGGAWLLMRDSEEQRILDLLDQVRDLAEVRDPENAVTQIGRARQLGSLFTPSTRYDLTTLHYGITEIDSREELTRRIAAARSRLLSLELSLLAPDVIIDGDRATVSVTGTALGATRGGDGQFMDVHRVEIFLVRQDGDWLVSGGRHIRDERAAFEGGQALFLNRSRY